MYTLYWCPWTGSLAPQAVLEEVGTAYRLEKVDTKKGEHRHPAYLKVNPNGLVPAMTDGEGRTTFESAALVALLCERHPEARLAPAVGDPARGDFHTWLFFMADTVYPAFRRRYHSETMSTSAEDVPRIRARAQEHLWEAWRILDDALAGRPYLLGPEASACDIYLLMLASWFEPLNELWESCPNLARCVRTTAARPAVARALRTHEQANVFS